MGRNMSIRPMTRSRAIKVWCAAAALVAAAAIALGGIPTLGTAILLLAMGLVPPALALMLWPAADAATMAETIHDAKAR
jgi:hypothetical protein